ncbi:MAG: hypothetical protein GXP53_02260 [Deltaproteobacteria bacterium]|nr:hypothetical protein [Deltaproteobacteria bacterium]
MKQKYILSRDMDKGLLTIREFSELSKDSFTLVCEESYEDEKIEKSLAEGKEALIKTLRTPNFYPVAIYIEKIADVVISLFEKKKSTDPCAQQELLFDDADLFVKKEKVEEEAEEEAVEIEDLLDAPEEGAKADKDKAKADDKPSK